MSRLDEIRARVLVEPVSGTVTLPVEDVTYLMNEAELREDGIQHELKSTK